MNFSPLFGPPEMVGVTRGLAEFRAGRPVEIICKTQSIVALPMEGLTPARLAAFREYCEPNFPEMVVTARRAAALGTISSAPVVLRLARENTAATIIKIAAGKA